MEDSSGRIWIAGRQAGGICRLVENAEISKNIVDRCYTKKDGLSSDTVFSFYQSTDGVMWILTNEKITQMIGFDEKQKPIFRILDSTNGLTDKKITDLTDDRDGNFWIATTTGVIKLIKQGFTKYNETDGLPKNNNFESIFTGNSGEIIIANHPNERNISVFQDGKFTDIKPKYPKEIEYWGSGRNAVLQTSDGEWWITSGNSVRQQKEW